MPYFNERGAYVTTEADELDVAEMEETNDGEDADELERDASPLDDDSRAFYGSFESLRAYDEPEDLAAE